MNRAALFALAAAAGFHPVQGGAVMYHAAARKLFALNPPAALVWLDLRHGKADAEIRADLGETFSIGTGQAAEWLGAALASFEVLLADDVAAGAEETTSSPPQPPADAPGTDYDFLGRRIRIARPESLRPSLDSLLGGLGRPRDGDADFALAVAPHGSELALTTSSGASVLRPADELVAEIEAEIVRNVVPLVPHMLAFHAALLAWGDTAVLFPGQSGVGKTTLSTLLATRGWRYATDEMAMLTRSDTWRGLPFPPCVKAVNYERIEQWLPRLAETPELRRFGQPVKFAPVGVESLEAELSTVVFPQFRSGAGTALEPLAPFEGLSRLLGQCIFVPLGFAEGDVPRLLGWHQRCRYFTLQFSDAQSAATALEMQLSGLD